MQNSQHGASAWINYLKKKKRNTTNKKGKPITRNVLKDYVTKCYPPAFVPMLAFVETFASLPPFLKQNSFY
jgi:hypothetical protein